MSEASDPTAGELECSCPDDDCRETCPICIGLNDDAACAAQTARQPAEPDTGEALAKGLASELHRLTFPAHPGCPPRPSELATAERVIASDWLDAVRRKAGADALTDFAARWGRSAPTTAGAAHVLRELRVAAQTLRESR